MSPSLTAFIESRMPQAGVAAWSMRDSDGTLAHHCYSDAPSPDQAEGAVGVAALAAESVRPYGIDHALLCWVYSRWRMHAGLRADGGCLVLFVENHPSNLNVGHEAVIDEFLRVVN